MARGIHTVLPAIFLILTLGASPSAAAGSQALIRSINCGGKAYNDPDTGIYWEGDPLNADKLGLYGKAGKVDSRLPNIAYPMTTLRYFPADKRNLKFCYKLQISSGLKYLVRASFLYGNYDGLEQPPSFVLLFNSQQWANVSTASSSSGIPIVYELIFNSTGLHDVAICLAPYVNSSQVPFISTLELRLLDQTMYGGGDDGGALSRGYGLMLWRRINYGARNSAPIRYPNDIYDRVWDANTTGPIAMTNNTSPSSDGSDQENPPVEVMETAITTRDPKGNLTFTFEEYSGYHGFRVEMHFQDVGEETNGQTTLMNLYVEFSVVTQHLSEKVTISTASPVSIVLDGFAEFPSPFQVTVSPVAGSSRGPLLNAIELFRWTPQLSFAAGTSQNDVDAIIQIQTKFNLVGYGQGDDPCIPGAYAWTWIQCNRDSPPRITAIDLGSSNLKGDIPSSIGSLTYLTKIDLSNNMLTGGIPNLSLLVNLEYLDFHHNKLNGTLPQYLQSLDNLSYLNIDNNDFCGSIFGFQSIQNFTDIGNPKLCNDINCNCSSSSLANAMITSQIEKKSIKYKYIYAISFLAAALVAMLTFFLIFMAIYNKRNKQANSSIANKKGVNYLQCHPFSTRMFTYKEICSATLDFITLLGEGGFGKVYHGLLLSGEAIAVKLLADVSRQGLKEFSNEVAILSRVHHKNLVSLIGYCTENTYMLIYEFISKGNLRDLLYGEGESSDKPLSWTTRLQIALDASQGLEYLHTGCDPAIIHRDVKSSNILLTDKMQAKVSDFGLSRLKEGDSTISHVSTVNVVGTPGYLDPAYNTTNQLTDKSDVYSFGVVLFELICGRAPIDMYSSPPHILDWVTPAIVHGKLGDIVDPMLANEYKVESMWKVIDLAFGCVEKDRMQRPRMSRVAHVLREALEIEMDPNLIPFDRLLDVSGSSATSDGKLPNLQYIESLRSRLEPR